MMSARIFIIGIDDSSSPCFSNELLGVIKSGRVFSGGARHRQIVSSSLPVSYEWIDIVPPMNSLFEEYRKHSHIVVFASGDPLFYGFAQTVQRLMPDAEITIYPHFNSLQQLAHKILMPYQDMHAVSLTGRKWDRFDEALIRGCDLIGVLTDRAQHTPQTIAQRMLDYGYNNYTITIGELLGNSDERVRTMALEEAITTTFKYPNNIILKRQAPRKRHFGIADNLFELLDGRERMITKMPIRLTTISQLDLHNARCMWDIGFCTGSVSIEAKLQFPHLRVESFEIREGCDKIIEANMRRFGALGINYTIGDFTQIDLNEKLLPPPDAIFIGGYGGKLDQIVKRAVSYLTLCGVVVFNSVSEKSRNEFCRVANKWGLKISCETTIKVGEYNTITIIKATK